VARAPIVSANVGGHGPAAITSISARCSAMPASSSVPRSIPKSGTLEMVAMTCERIRGLGAD
jgi:hypothetical protein